MDGGDAAAAALTVPVAEVDVGEGPAPWVTPDAMAERALRRASGGRRGLDVERAQDLAEAAAERRAAREPDKLIRLYHAGRLTAAELWAAHDLRDVVLWVSDPGAPQVRGQFRERLAPSTDGGFDDRWLGRIEAEHTRYLPWRAWARGFPVSRAGATLEDLTLLFVVEGLGLRQVRGRLRMDERRALALLRRSLRHYAYLGGRADSPEPERLA